MSAEVVIETTSSWAEYSAALATLLAATVAGGIAARSIHNRRKADVRAEWWKRVQYAIEQCLSRETQRQRIGLEMITVLGSGHPAGSTIEEPRKWPWRLFLRPPGHSAWVADEDDKIFLSGLADLIVEAMVEAPSEEPSTESRWKWLRWTHGEK